MSFCQQKQNNANTHKAHMLYKAGQLLLSLCYRLGNVEINDQSRKPARAPFPWFSVLHPRYHLGGGMRVQLCFTKTERALVMGNNRPAPEGGGTVPTAPPVFSPDDLSHFTGNHVCSRPSWELQPFNFQPQSWRWASAHGGVGAVRGAQPEQSSRPAWQWQPSPPPGHPHAQGSRRKAGARGTGQSRGRWLGLAAAAIPWWSHGKTSSAAPVSLHVPSSWDPRRCRRTQQPAKNSCRPDRSG